MENHKGFTLIELMVVISIIGILAAIAMPSFNSYRNKAFVSEGYQIFRGIKKNIKEFYETTGRFPKDNFEAGLPSPEKIRGKYVEKVKIENGVTHIFFDKDLDLKDRLKNNILTINPGVSKDNPSSPLFFITDKTKIQDWMLVKDSSGKEI